MFFQHFFIFCWCLSFMTENNRLIECLRFTWLLNLLQSIELVHYFSPSFLVTRVGLGKEIHVPVSFLPATKAKGFRELFVRCDPCALRSSCTFVFKLYCLTRCYSNICGIVKGSDFLMTTVMFERCYISQKTTRTQHTSHIGISTKITLFPACLTTWRKACQLEKSI